MANKPVIPVPPREAAEIERKLLEWINQYEALEARINYEFLKPDAYSLAMSTIQTARRRDILGGYSATYQFRIIFRLQPMTNDERLSADEFLNTMAVALESAVPPLGEDITNAKIEAPNGAEITAAYQDGSEDHAINLILTYEVNR